MRRTQISFSHGAPDTRLQKSFPQERAGAAIDSFKRSSRRVSCEHPPSPRIAADASMHSRCHGVLSVLDSPVLYAPQNDVFRKRISDLLNALGRLGHMSNGGCEHFGRKTL